MPLTPQNKQMAIDVLNGMSLSKAAKKYGKSRGRPWQVARAFCLEHMFYDERTDITGKLKDLKGLRKVQNIVSRLNKQGMIKRADRGLYTAVEEPNPAS